MVLRHRLDEIYYWRWYVVELPILLPVFAGVGSELLVARVRDARIRTAAILALCAAMAPSVVDVATVAKPAPEYVDRGEWNQTVLRLALEARGEWPLPERERIGAFSAGLLGWFAERPVINLDGLANDEILPYWKAGTLAEYCQRRNITLYIDAAPPEDSFREFSILRTVPISGDRQYPRYYFVRLPASGAR
ncbi:MAG TPA: hypothetical protein VF147_01020 [Vicinamibacterales bacterium]